MDLEGGCEPREVPRYIGMDASYGSLGERSNETPYWDLYDALGQLKPGDRTILHLFYYEELSVREIAELLSYRESNVRTKLTRARRRLAEIMKGETEDEVEI